MQEIARPTGSGADAAKTSDPPTGEWVVQPLQTEAGFTARGFWGLVPVGGAFDRVEGRLTVDADLSCRALLRVQTSSLRTGINVRDAHLRGKDFLAAKEHPEISFTGAGRLDDGTLLLTGGLEIAGVSREVHLEAPVEWRPTELRVRCELSIRLPEYGIKPPLGMVRPDVELRVAAALQPASAENEETAP